MTLQLVRATKLTTKKRLFAPFMGLLAALFAIAVAASPAQAATTSVPFNGYDGDHVVRVSGSITFNTNGTAAVSGTGYDLSADGYGPYLRIYWGAEGGGGWTTDVGCAAGAGNSCTIPTQTRGGSGSNAVTHVQVLVCKGSGGNCANFNGYYVDKDNPYN